MSINNPRLSYFAVQIIDLQAAYLSRTYLAVYLESGERQVAALPARVLAVLLYAQVAVGRVAAHAPRGRAARLLQRLLVAVRHQRVPAHAVR